MEEGTKGAVYWKSFGKIKLSGDGYITGIAVLEDNVYVVGQSTFDEFYSVATIWGNGMPTHLTLMHTRILPMLTGYHSLIKMFM